jgi:hypothetical protein
LLNNAHTRPPPREVTDAPNIALTLKIIHVDARNIEKVFGWFAVITIQSSEAKDLNFGCYRRELLPDAIGCVFAGCVRISENSDPSSVKLLYVFGEEIDAGTERSHYANRRKLLFGVSEMERGQRVLATFDNQQDVAAIIRQNIIKSD